MISHLTPIIGTIAYFSFPKNVTINKNSLQCISYIHNTALILFSGWTFVSLVNLLRIHGIVFQENYYFQIKEFDTLIYYFYLSKYYEFVDTFLITLSGKTPLFLQKYHHVGAVICWHLCYYYKTDFIWMPTILNSFIHSIMYFYYLLSLAKIQQIRRIKKYITSLQLIQFAVNYINLYFYFPPVETIFNYIIMNVFALYGVGLLFLFGKFFTESYIGKMSN